MLALVLRGFVQRKLRVLLTAIAIALGVALMAGTYILTDTIDRSFAGIFQTANKGHDAVITPAQLLGKNSGAEATPIGASLLAKVRSVPGVAQAEGIIFSPVNLLDAHGKRLTSGNAPGFVTSEAPPRFSAISIVRGSRPANASQVAIDEATAERQHLKLGQQLIVAGRAPAHHYTLVGITRFGGGESFGGASVALLTLPEAQRVVQEQGRYDEIVVAAGAGLTPSQVRDRLRTDLPGGITVRTGSEQARHETVELEENLGFLRTFLLVFAYIALFVGAFIIFNTFSITVAQRTREFALLRVLGGSRTQVLRAVFYEGLMLGLLGAGIGLLGGIALAPALDQLFKAFGADLPDSGTVLETRTIVVSLAVGIGVTVLSGLPAALRATRVPPIAALREGVEIPRRASLTRGRYAVPVLLALITIRLVVAIVTGEGGTTIAIVLAIGVALLFVRLRQRARGRRYRVTRALAGAIGALVSWRGITGRLARENSMRQPGRTLTTAAALTIGLALVAFAAVLAAGTKATIDHAVDRAFAGNLIVENTQSTGEAGIPAVLAGALRRVPGVATVTPVAFTLGRTNVSSSNVTVTAIEPATFARLYRVEWKHGSDSVLGELEHGGTVVTQKFASAHHLVRGRLLHVRTPTGRRVSLRVVGIASDNAELLGPLTISLALAASAFGERQDALDFLSYRSGFGDSQVQPAVQRLLHRDFPQTRSRTEAQFEHEQASKVNGLLELIYVLLALSVIVSLFGIVNTLILSVYERTRELGMMRAIGTSRRQVRQMIRYESLITALIGGVLGLAIGLIAAVLVTSLALSGSGYVQSFPVGTLLILLVVAALAGVLASQPPARRAARVDMLQALASE